MDEGKRGRDAIVKYYEERKSCRSCGEVELIDFYQKTDIPVAGIYYNDGESKVNIQAPMNVVFCKTCGLIQLRETISSDIYKDYSFVGNSAASYKKYLEQFSLDLVEKWGVFRKNVYEIGASNGVLLSYLRQQGENNVSGIEPSLKLCEAAHDLGVDIQQGYFGSQMLSEKPVGKVDCVIIRHVLEHIDNLKDMISSVKQIISDQGLLVIEVPNVKRILDEFLFSNLFHEHLNYFSIESLNFLLHQFGFEVIEFTEVDIHGGSILAFYKLRNVGSEHQNFINSDDLEAAISRFSNHANNYYESLTKLVYSLRSKNLIVHGYGASHRTFVLLGNSNLTEADIPILYDNNSFLWNKRLNGSGSLVMPIETIENNAPDAIIIFATSYENEIVQVLKSKCNYQGQIISIKYPLLF
ncbi:MAG: methyltransferase domain-containing protein [Sporomusaceae bacterium]|nr:methyltransferase domain-containing protein [Sporomusaceae bacterium]